VPICGGRALPYPGCRGDGLADVNPFFYKFNCYKDGTLGFLITPKNIDDDYDWELYDVTLIDPERIYTDGSLVIANNWSGETGYTGASSAGTQQFVCGGLRKPLFSKMPVIQAGHNYLLLISHFTQSQSGYDLSFGGGTAVITDETIPAFKTSEANCGGDVIRIKLNKGIRCNSLAADGSDFSLSPAAASITSVKGIGCATGFDTDSLEIQLSAPLAPGSYSIVAGKGADGNTLLDYCDNAMPVSAKTDFTIYAKVPTPMDSLEKPKCNPRQLRLVFRKPIACSSIAANGSDFIVMGSYPVTVVSAAGSCSSGTTKEIFVNLSRPLSDAGSFRIILQTGTDGNTLLDECTTETPAGAFLPFNVMDTVNAAFTYMKSYGCTADTVRFFHDGAHGVTSWSWQLDENKTSTNQNPEAYYQFFTTKSIRLIVDNGFCRDTSTQSVALTNGLKADFSVFEDNCPNEAITFTSLAQGIALQHQWDFGDGGGSSDANPTHAYAQPAATRAFLVRYTITDSIGCQKTVQKPVSIYSSCLIAVPSAFTPNNDGLNDRLYPLNAVKAENLEFKVFNRWGQLIFQTKNWRQGWDGTIKGIPQASGTYVWYLSFIYRDTKQQRTMRGTATLIR
jgi:gliding motility-associated-like protein